MSTPPSLPRAGVPEKKGGSGLLPVLLVILAVCGVFAAVLLAPMVRSSGSADVPRERAAEGNEIARMIVAAQEMERWPVHEVAGMRLAMPEMPVMGKQEAPAAVREVVVGGAFNVGTVKTSDFQIGLVQVSYTSEDLSLEGMRDGAMAEIEALPGVSRMLKRPGKRTISGKPALTMEASYYNAGHKIFQGMIFVADGQDAWQATVIGKPVEGGVAWDRVLETFAIPALETAE